MIERFDSERYEFLSNFFTSPISDGTVLFPTVEHYFQAAKTCIEEDYLAIANASTPGQAKRLGRTVHLREDWEDVKDQVMLDAVRKKFEIPALKELLLQTGDEEIQEGNSWHDNYWGMCYCSRCGSIKGNNKLGKILMQVRKELE